METSQKNIPRGSSTLTSIKSKLNSLKISKDFYSPESIDLLETAGIDFKALAVKGISPGVFAENLIPSGLLLNENVNWVTFHGSYDFAYLLKNVTNLPLPEEETIFFKSLETYFPNFYDVRYLINNNNLLWMKGSLAKMANMMDIKRLGSTHQAGSDSLITSKLFFKLEDTYPEHLDLLADKNKVFGISYNCYEDFDNGMTSSTTGTGSLSSNCVKNFSESFNKGYGFNNNNNVNLGYNNEGYGMLGNSNSSGINLGQN